MNKVYKLKGSSCFEFLIIKGMIFYHIEECFTVLNGYEIGKLFSCYFQLNGKLSFVIAININIHMKI